MAYSIHEQDSIERKDWYLYQPFSTEQWNEYPFATEQDLQWFRDAKYGLFLHVGLSAIGKVDLSWPRHTHIMPDVGNGWVADKTYDGWAKKLAFKDFDAAKWARVAKQSGFRYVVIIAKHHDGFHMWDTQLSSYKVTNSPFGRDYLAELTEAFRNEGLKIGIYFSKRDWKHPDYEPIDTSVAHSLKDPPHVEFDEGHTFEVTQKQKKYIEYLFGVVKELMTNYGKIDVLWWDSQWNGGMFNAEMWQSAELEKEVRKLQPHILINNRSSLVGDFDTPECIVGAFQNCRPWESCMCIGRAWSWTGGKPKKRDIILSQLINCVCGDGNYLLSTGCMPSGDLGKLDIKRMQQIGKWLEQYSQSIFGTRGGIWTASDGVLSCYKDNIIYLHILKDYQGKHIQLALNGNEIVDYQVLTGESIDIRFDKQMLEIEAVGNKNFDVVVKLICKDNIQAIKK